MLKSNPEKGAFSLAVPLGHSMAEVLPESQKAEGDTGEVNSVLSNHIVARWGAGV